MGVLQECAPVRSFLLVVRKKSGNIIGLVGNKSVLYRDSLTYSPLTISKPECSDKGAIGFVPGSYRRSLGVYQDIQEHTGFRDWGVLFEKGVEAVVLRV